MRRNKSTGFLRQACIQETTLLSDFCNCMFTGMYTCGRVHVYRNATKFCRSYLPAATCFNSKEFPAFMPGASRNVDLTCVRAGSRKLKSGVVSWAAPWLRRLLLRNYFSDGHWQLVETLLGNKVGHQWTMLDITVHPRKASLLRVVQLGLHNRESNFLTVKPILNIGRFVHGHGGIRHLELVKQQMHANCDMVGRVASDNAETAFVPCQAGSNPSRWVATKCCLKFFSSWHFCHY